MSDAGITITIDDAPVRDALARLAAAAADLTPLTDEVGGALEVSVQRRFELGQGPGGTPWPPSLRALVEGGQTLVDRGVRGGLLGTLTHNVIDAGRSVEVGVNKIYAAIHQFGGTVRPKNARALVFTPPGLGHPVSVQSVTIPARPFLGIDDDDMAEISAIVTDWVARAAGPEMAA